VSLPSLDSAAMIRSMDQDIYEVVQKVGSGIFAAPLSLTWRGMLADRRAARAALVLFDLLAAREALRGACVAATVRPRGRK
jgi:hypothetical protein